MLRKPFLLKIYEAADMQRWNDQIRFVEMTELDKQAHKMLVAYVLAKCEEDNKTPGLDWVEIIEGGIFEFLQRIVLTDLKPPLFHRIKENRDKYSRLNEWVYEKIHPLVLHLGDDFCRRFKGYLMDSERNINRRIISAAHFYATKWEFDIIERANPRGHEIEEIRADLKSKQDKYHDLASMQKVLGTERLRDFIDICGQLRFQVRWSHVHRIPKTSVLGHMLVVAMFTYLFSQQMGLEKRRCVNNYLTGLLHDLPEVLTRDVINPVKRAIEGLKELIKEYERQEMERKIYKLLPQSWCEQIRKFTDSEYNDITGSSGEIERDGALVKGADDLAAFIEAYLAWKNGIWNESLEGARFALREEYKSRVISGIDFGQIYADFD